MAVPPQFADQTLVFQDIGKTAGSNTQTDDLVNRSDQKASSDLQTIFLNNVDFDNVEGWFTELATDLTTATFWYKSNGTTEAQEKVDKILEKAKEINTDRFFPVEFRK